MQVNRYERNPEARAKCIEIHKARCKICEMSFAETYGTFAKDFIHVHHLTQIANIGNSYKINPKTDLRPVCPNCHAIIHKRNPAYTIEEVKKFISANQNHFEF